ncbi:uncharacterized protein [Eucyclogobius newberryi]|uniref:uncharacterized protein n=1 Tax=Eucyclogobius newberryi TaxID=166745 RepID=UPI003B5BF555
MMLVGVMLCDCLGLLKVNKINAAHTCPNKAVPLGRDVALQTDPSLEWTVQQVYPCQQSLINTRPPQLRMPWMLGHALKPVLSNNASAHEIERKALAHFQTLTNALLHSRTPPLSSINSTFVELCPWTDFLHTPDNVNYLTKNLNSNSKETVVVHYTDNILAKLFSDAIYCRDVWSVEITGPFLIEDTNRREISSNNNHDQSQSDGLNKDCSDSCICDGKMEKKSGQGIRRKSVSFADDVIVYLYDKDSPADKFSADNHTSPSSNLSEVLFDDNGLEWEDDFLALEKNCHPHNHPESCPFTFSLPTQNWTIPKPKSLFLSQSCLFLTHINESDLEP